MIVRPDYTGRGIVNLCSSILSTLGVESPYNSLNSDVLDTLSEYDNIVLLILDGLGTNYLQEKCANTLLAKSKNTSLTSVFPPSTGSAITSYFTGLAPQQHTFIGWFVYLIEFGLVSRILPFSNCIDWNVLGSDINTVIGCTPLFHEIEAEHHLILGENIVDSVYSRFMSGEARRDGYRNSDDFFNAIGTAISSSDHRRYIHAYWPKYDDISHILGSDSEEALQSLLDFDNQLNIFTETIEGTNTKIIVTSDHGFHDVPPENLVHTSYHPELLECLILPICGDTRTGFCYIRPKKVGQFERYIVKNLEHACELHPSNSLVEDNWFGLFEPNPKLMSRVGDYTLIMKDRYAILNHFPGVQPPRLLGHHGGTSASEMLVPLITIDC
jgi:hypothetical protein